MNSVFIFGAGASRFAGAPLMYDFLDRAYDLIRLQIHGVVETQKDFIDVFNAISELQGIYYKSYLDLDNIETVFGAIETGLLLKKFGKRDEESIKQLRSSLITLIYKTLEYSIKFPVQNGRIFPPKPYDKFIEALKEVEKTQNYADPNEFVFMTFNYDFCLDSALFHMGKRINYCLEPGIISGSIPLLKLHGSINWALLEDDKIIPFHIHQAYHPLIGEEEYVYYDLGSNLENIPHEGKQIKNKMPVLIPPTWNKNIYNDQISNVWSRAALELSSAQNIFVIGYSLPETDSFFKYLFAIGTESPVKLRNLIVINNDLSGQVEKRFRQFIGKGIEHRFTYISEPFENSIRSIKKILISP